MTALATAVAAKGLSSVPQLAPGIPTPQASPAARFAGTDLVTAAAALFDNSPWLLAPNGRGGVVGVEGRMFRLTVSPGTVGLSVRDPARLERNRQNGLGHDPQTGSPVYELVGRVPEGEERWRRVRGDDGRYEDSDGFLNWTERDTVYDLAVAVEADGVTPVRREGDPVRQVKGWSSRSRARMVRTLAQLDWSPMYPDALGYGLHLGYGDPLPAVMLTLTYPGDWLPVAPTGKAVKRHLDLLRKRHAKAWGAPLVGPWKLEFQRRGAPHFHLLIVPPRGTVACRCAVCACWCGLPDCDTVCGTQLRFADWLSHAWADVVAHPDPEQRHRHRLAGTGLDYLKGGRCFDPKRAAVYFSKHGGAAGGKEYQHDVPQEWQAQGAGPGRFWGYWQLEKVTASVDLDLVDYLKIRRTMRRWAKQSGNSRRVIAQRVDTATGEVSYRTRRRKGLASLNSRALLGGTALVNDGPAFASVLARLVAVCQDDRAGAGRRSRAVGGVEASCRGAGMGVIV